MPKINPKMAVAIAQEIVGLSQVVHRALSIIEDPKFRIGELAQTLAIDQALAAQILKWANSPFYGRRSEVATLDQAIMVLGTATIRDLLLEASSSSMLNAEVPAYGLERGALWRHSVAVAAGARWLALTNEYPNPSEVFVAGLLHDIGKLTYNEIIMRNRSLRSAWARRWSEGVTFLELERWLAGLDHAQLGGIIVGQWNLPSVLQTAIAYHHRPSQANGKMPGPPVAQWVCWADTAAHMLEKNGTNSTYDISASLEGLPGASPLDLELLMDVEAEAISDSSDLLT